MAYAVILLLKKKCEKLLHLQKLPTFCSKNTCELDIVLTRTTRYPETPAQQLLDMINWLHYVRHTLSHGVCRNANVGIPANAMTQYGGSNAANCSYCVGRGI